ncbi:chloride channel protein [Accumulibacter sp.]|uniref:chloride channel protein n=1 Tax=Accumulibacter sp. TaxID=2053492 RepID=UPI0025D15DF1|nr:chloride channel protein [Accumulibacter sp.]MCP5229499.1 chloride channel protein [Accumulibacter sp.]
MSFLRGRLSTFRWRTRLALWGAAACAGLAVVAFTKLTDLALSTFFELANTHPWLPFPWVPFVAAPMAGMAAVWLGRRFFAGSQGSGIPQVIAASRLAARGEDVSHLVSLRIAIGKVGAGCIALLGGFSAGREGPSAQVAASILHFAHRLLPHSRAIAPADLILAGGAAGIAAAFNTPLAGIVFAVEELGRRLEARTTGILVSTIILSGLVAIALEGNYSHFGRMKVSEFGDIVIPVVVYGMACGVLGGIFSRLLLWPQTHPHFLLWRWRSAYPVRFAGGCGLVVALVGWLGGGLSYGSGYSVTSALVSGDALSAPWHAPVTRYVATVVTYFSGIPGGIFAPSLAVGAAFGASTAQILGFPLEALPITALCMAGFLAAVTQSPITAAIIVMEMIDGHGMVISLMSVTLIANAVSSRISPELYQELARGFMAKPASPPERPAPPVRPRAPAPLRSPEPPRQASEPSDSPK